MTAAVARVPSATAVSLDNLVDYARDRLQAAATYPRERLIRRDFALARLDLTVWFASEALAELCDKAFVRRNFDDPTANRIEVFALDAESGGWQPPLVWQDGAEFSSRKFDRTLAASNLRGFYHHDAPSWQFFDPISRRGVLTLLTEVGIPPWESSSPLRLFLHWAYAATNMRLTHAATLGLHGRGALIVGASGSGKSGTTLAGLLHGLDSVGDDYVLVERNKRLIAHPVFAMLKQDPEGLRRVGVAERIVDTAELNWHGKIEFDASKVAPRGLADQMEIRALLLPEIARLRQTRIESAASRDGALFFAPSAVLQLPGDSIEGFRFFAGIVRSLPAFRLRLSEDPAEIAEAIASLLSGRNPDAG